VGDEILRLYVEILEKDRQAWSKIADRGVGAMERITGAARKTEDVLTRMSHKKVGVKLEGATAAADEAERLKRKVDELPSRKEITVEFRDRAAAGMLRTQSAFDQMHRATGGLGKAFGTLASYLGFGMSMGVGAAFSYVAKTGLEFNKTQETIQTTLRASLNGYAQLHGHTLAVADATATLTSQLQKLSSASPYTFQATEKLGQQIAAYRIPLSEIVNTTRTIQELQALHPNMPRLTRTVIRTFGQISQQGATTSNLQQLERLGVPVSTLPASPKEMAAIKSQEQQIQAVIANSKAHGETAKQLKGLTQQLDLLKAKSMLQGVDLTRMPPAQVIALINRAMQTQYGGVLPALAQTEAGRGANISSAFGVISGGLMQPMSDAIVALQKQLGPVLNQISTQFALPKNRNMSFQARVDLIWHDLVKAGIPQTVGHMIVSGFKAIGKTAVAALWAGFENLSPLQKAVAVMGAAFLIQWKTGVIGKLGNLIGGASRAAGGDSMLGVQKVWVVRNTAGPLDSTNKGGSGILSKVEGEVGAAAGAAGLAAKYGVTAAEDASRFATATSWLDGPIGSFTALIPFAAQKDQLGPGDPAYDQVHRQYSHHATQAPFITPDVWRNQAQSSYQSRGAYGGKSGLEAVLREIGTLGGQEGKLAKEMDSAVTGMTRKLDAAGPKFKSSAANVTGAITTEVKSLPKSMQGFAEDAMAQMIAKMAQKGQISKSTAAQVEKGIVKALGPLSSDTAAIVAAATGALNTGLQQMIANANAAARSVGGSTVSSPALSIGVFAGIGNGGSTGTRLFGFAGGGRIPGVPKGDHIPLVASNGVVLGIADGGELVVNRHTESRVDNLLGMFGTSLSHEVSAETKPHFATGGRTSAPTVPAAHMPGSGDALDNYGNALLNIVDKDANSYLARMASVRLSGAISFANSQLGLPYIWGGGHGGVGGPGKGWDCSGFSTTTAEHVKGYTGGVTTTYGAISAGTMPHTGNNAIVFGFSNFGARGNNGPGHMGIRLNGQWYQAGNPVQKGGNFAVQRIPAGLAAAGFAKGGRIKDPNAVLLSNLHKEETKIRRQLADARRGTGSGKHRVVDHAKVARLTAALHNVQDQIFQIHHVSSIASDLGTQWSNIQTSEGYYANSLTSGLDVSTGGQPTAAETVGVELSSATSNLRRDKSFAHSLQRQINAALRNHNKALAAILKEQLAQVDDAIKQQKGTIARDMYSKAQAVFQQNQATQQVAEGTAASAVTGFQGAAHYAGKDIAGIQLHAQLYQGGQLTAGDLADAQKYTTGLNDLIGGEISSYQTELGSDTERLSHMRKGTSDYNALQSTINSLNDTITGLNSQIKDNNDAMAQLTQATFNSAAAMNNLAGGSVAFSYNGQSYTVGQTSDLYTGMGY
jgi:hypothetical protein